LSELATVMSLSNVYVSHSPSADTSAYI